MPPAKAAYLLVASGLGDVEFAYQVFDELEAMTPAGQASASCAATA